MKDFKEKLEFYRNSIESKYSNNDSKIIRIWKDFEWGCVIIMFSEWKKFKNKNKVILRDIPVSH